MTHQEKKLNIFILQTVVTDKTIKYDNIKKKQKVRGEYSIWRRTPPLWFRDQSAAVYF